MNTLKESLLEVQGQIGKIVKTENNKFTKSKYESLDAVLDAALPLLLTNGILLTNTFIKDDGQLFYSTLFTKGDEELRVNFLVIIPPEHNNFAHLVASYSTYGRRYNLKQALNISTVDDDGVGAGVTKRTCVKKDNLEDFDAFI